MSGSTEPTPPRVSVVIPAYNAEASIEDALGDVLGQRYADLEVIVCDDGSTDETAAIATEILEGQDRVCWQLLRLPGGLGAAGARNAGIQVAQGEFVAFLDDDDRWATSKIERCVQALDERSLDLVCHAEYWTNDAGDRRIRVYQDLFNPTVPPIVSLMRNNPFSTSAVVVRRASLVAAGLFDSGLPSAEDFDLWVRLVLLPSFRLGFIDDPLGEYALRDGSESSKVDRRRRALVEIGRRYRSRLKDATWLHPLEYWAYRARTELTTGFRYLGQRRYGRALFKIGVGAGMWPFRLDWIRLALRERRRNRTLMEMQSS